MSLLQRILLRLEHEIGGTRLHLRIRNTQDRHHSFHFKSVKPVLMSVNELMLFFFALVALMCRMIQVLILIYGIAYLMIHKKGYQETDTSIISSITLKVKVSGKANLSLSLCCTDGRMECPSFL